MNMNLSQEECFNSVYRECIKSDKVVFFTPEPLEKKHQETEPEPLGKKIMNRSCLKKKSGAGAAKKLAGSPALYTPVYKYKNKKCKQ